MRTGRLKEASFLNEQSNPLTISPPTARAPRPPWRAWLRAAAASSASSPAAFCQLRSYPASHRRPAPHRSTRGADDRPWVLREGAVQWARFRLTTSVTTVIVERVRLLALLNECCVSEAGIGPNVGRHGRRRNLIGVLGEEVRLFFVLRRRTGLSGDGVDVQLKCGERVTGDKHTFVPCSRMHCTAAWCSLSRYSCAARDLYFCCASTVAQPCCRKNCVCNLRRSSNLCARSPHCRCRPAAWRAAAAMSSWCPTVSTERMTDARPVRDARPSSRCR